MRTCILLCLILASSSAFAQDVSGEVSEESGLRPAIGARIGGYGFRQLNQDNNFDWFLCRMDGVGIFGTLDITDHVYAELSTDLYFATQETMRQGLDRISLHTVASGGLRLFPGALITPNIHAGGGAEFTWVRVYGNERQEIVPVGFLGIGGELNWERLHLGMSIRANAMQLPEYDWNSPETTPDQVAMRTEVAGQMMFSVRYTL